jgi:lipopolysaccharide/colanic/teichoic acid biosynthesis glycosyltransferase
VPQAYSRRVESELSPGSAHLRGTHARIGLNRTQQAHLAPFYLSMEAERCRESIAKRMLDIAIGGLLLAVFLPLVALIAAAIKASSRGPVLFQQRRLGVQGRPFVMYKFRTMRNGASQEPHRTFVSRMVDGRAEATHCDGVYKLRNDDRVTPIGRLLRRSSLDELPQLLNVLRGEMSIVGPRPAIDYEVELYQAWQFERLAVRPGITGRWQVFGRNRLTYYQMCQRDVEYVRTWSLRQDLIIMARTPWVMLMNSGGAS